MNVWSCTTHPYVFTEQELLYLYSIFRIYCSNLLRASLQLDVRAPGGGLFAFDIVQSNFLTNQSEFRIF
jgi:hypothetical protein